MSFGGGSSSANREIIELQKEQARKAEAKEAARQARLAYGRNKIAAIFEGGDVGPAPSWGSGMSEFVNPEWTALQEARQAALADTGKPRKLFDPSSASDPDRSGFAGFLRPNFSSDRSNYPDGPDTDVLFRFFPKNSGGSSGPSQYLTNQQALDAGLISPEEAGFKQYSGIGQDFYDSYRSSLDDFYYPELERQYGEAKSQNLFDLARKGLLRSSEAAERAGELARDYSENRAQIGSQIESQVTGLQDSVNRSRRNALNLLTSTEDPTSAANQALTEVNAVRTQKPQFNDLGNLFADVLNTFGIAQQAARQREYLDSIPMRGAYESSGSYYG